MTQADSVYITPPTNTSRSRRTVLAGIASAAALPIAAAIPTPAAASADPIFAVMDAFRRVEAPYFAVPGDIPDELSDQYFDAYSVVLRTRPTTPAGLAALTTWAREQADWLCANASYFDGEELCALTAAIDDATRGMSGLEPWSPPSPAASAHPDAEIIQLGARFEPLVDRYYVAQRRWSRSLVAAHAEHDREFGTPAERNFQYLPEIVAAFSDSCERSGVNEGDDVLSAIHAEMKQLMNAINAASVTSIEGLRASISPNEKPACPH
jgi:hypothetical protein